MKLNIIACLAAVILPTIPAFSAVENGKPAPDFTLTDSNGKSHSLSDFKGKLVVLEWTNRECPFVQKQYGSGNMQQLQKELTGDGVIWLSIVSSAPGKQGYVTPEEANKNLKEKGAAPTALLLDADGKTGKLYDARTTPHMFIIDKEGILRYQGAIDDDDSKEAEKVKSARNYVRAAVEELKEGKPVSKAVTKPYGCNVKYGS